MVWKLELNKIKSKRGLSSVIATISLVLLSVVAVGILAGILVPFINNQLNEGTQCVGLENHFYFEEEFGYNCYRNSDYMYAISVGAQGDDDSNVGGLILAFKSEGESFSVEINDGDAVGSSEGEVRMLGISESNIEIPKRGEVRTFIYNGDKAVEAIDVAPILKSGKSCTPTDSIKMLGEICGDDSAFS